MTQTEMTYNPLGRCGMKVSRLSLGGWLTYGGSVAEQQEVDAIIRRAFEAGINFFDIADAYAKGEAEIVMGKVLADFPRHELVISSKLFWPQSDCPNDRGLSRKHIMESVEKSLKRIGTDYLDLYFCHRYDAETPVEETVRAMDDLVHQGKVLYWGTSEWTGAQLREANELAQSHNLYRPQVEQPQYSLLVRDVVEQDVAPAAESYGMGLVVWSPLASGLLTGKYDDGVPDGSRLSRLDWLRDMVRTDESLARVRQFKQVADAAGCSRTQLALAWTAAQPGISSVITGASSVDQLEHNLGALNVEITDDIRTQLNEIFTLPKSGEE